MGKEKKEKVTINKLNRDLEGLLTQLNKPPNSSPEASEPSEATAPAPEPSQEAKAPAKEPSQVALLGEDGDDKKKDSDEKKGEEKKEAAKAEAKLEKDTKERNRKLT